MMFAKGAVLASIPSCPNSLPQGIGDLIKELGRLWAESDACPQIEFKTKIAWDRLLGEWSDDNSLPLLVRKSSLVRGSEVVHKTGRYIIPTDNSPAQWACNLALRNAVPTVREIRDAFEKDTIPVSFAHKKHEKDVRKYHCVLGRYTINKAGWKLCHITPVGLNTQETIDNIDINDLKRAFLNLLSPSNYFLLPIEWGGLGEIREFVEGALGSTLYP